MVGCENVRWEGGRGVCFFNQNSILVQNEIQSNEYMEVVSTNSTGVFDVNKI